MVDRFVIEFSKCPPVNTRNHLIFPKFVVRVVKTHTHTTKATLPERRRENKSTGKNVHERKIKEECGSIHQAAPGQVRGVSSFQIWRGFLPSYRDMCVHFCAALFTGNGSIGLQTSVWDLHSRETGPPTFFSSSSSAHLRTGCQFWREKGPQRWLY